MQARNTTLREYQQQLFDRIHSLAGSEAASSHLGFEVGEQTWVVALTDISEVIPVPPLVSVPLTVEWFVGVANIRGSLFAICDYARFLNAGPTAITPESRLVLLHAKFRAHAGLLVRRSLGLTQLLSAAQPSGVRPLGQIAAFTDKDGRTWQELSALTLTRDPRFLRIAV